MKVEYSKLGMYDVLRDMRRDIVMKEGQRLEERSYLWDARTAVKVLSCQKVSVE